MDAAKLARLKETIAHGTSAIETFARIEEELRSMTNGIPDEGSRARIADMIRTNQEIIATTKKRMAFAEHQIEVLKGGI